VRLFYEAEGKAPSDDAERMAVKIMQAYLDDDKPEPVHLRVARHGNGVVLDLGTPDGSCVVVTADGWRIERRSPVVFRRAAALPLPEPERGPKGPAAGLAKLRSLVNTDDPQFRLAVGWLVAALIPGSSHPILLLRGQQGSAKSTLARILQEIIDPSGLRAGALPRDERDFAVRMNAAWVQSFDNVSFIQQWLSDALCRAATGDTFATRTLYTNRDVTILHYQRPVIMSTIDAGQLAADLIERSLPLDLHRIEPENRKIERAAIGDDPNVRPGLFDQLDKDRPLILGAILDLLADILRHLSGVAVDRLPRMADFGKVLAALDLAMGWQAFAGFSELVEQETGALLEQSAFAGRLVEFMQEHDEWRGTATDLLAALSGLLPDRDHPPSGWPKDATRAGGQLRRMAPSLRVFGIEVDYDREGRKGARTWLVRKIASVASAASAGTSDQGTRTDAGSGLPTLLTLADAGDSASVGEDRAGQPRETSLADAADAGSGVTNGFPVAEAGRCSWCGTLCHRYGPDGSPLCGNCQGGQHAASTSPATGTDWLRGRKDSDQ
jgi:hypothetical protein